MNSTFSKPSDQSHRIQVESHLIYCLWTCGRAWAGSNAPFEVKTSFVGEGAEIKIKLKNDSGKTLDKKSDKIFGNRYRGTVAVPSNVKLGDMLSLEVELPKHKLDGESNQVPAGPAIQARSMQWGQQEVRRGDIVTMQAQFIDLPDKTPAEITVYEYDPEGNHDPIVTLPAEINSNRLEVQWQYDYHNDVAQIPTQNEVQPYNKNYQQPQYFFVVEIDGNRIGVKQESGMVKFKDSYELRIVDAYGTPVPNRDIILHQADSTELNVKTDADGIVHLDTIVPGKTFHELK
jgi:hypothetical protein